MVATLLVLFTLFALALGNQLLICKTIDDMLDEEGVKELEAKFQELCESDENEPDDSAKICCDQDGLFYDGVCYIAILEKSNKKGAIEKCKRIGGLLAEIHTREQETALIEYLRPKINLAEHFWVGMEYHNPNVRYRSGKEIRNDQFQWRPGFPQSSARHTEMLLWVFKSKNSNEGLWNFHSDTLSQYAICEKSV